MVFRILQVSLLKKLVDRYFFAISKPILSVNKILKIIDRYFQNSEHPKQ